MNATPPTYEAIEVDPSKDIAGIRPDLKMTWGKIQLRKRVDYIAAGTFILRTMLQRQLPKALTLQLKKQLRKLESCIAIIEVSTADEEQAEVKLFPFQCRPVTDKPRRYDRGLQP